MSRKKTNASSLLTYNTFLHVGPVLRQECSLDFTDNGTAVLCTKGGVIRRVNTMDSSSLLRYSLYSDDELGEIVVVDNSSGEVSLYQDWVRQYKSKMISVPRLGSSDPGEVAAFITDHRLGGSCVYWSLPSLHQSMALGGRPNDWYHKHFLEWRQYMGQKMNLSFVDLHVRRGEELPGASKMRPSAGSRASAGSSSSSDRPQWQSPLSVV